MLAASGNRSAESERALAEFCADYWYPLYAYVRRRGIDSDDARDLPQSFFTRTKTVLNLTATAQVMGTPHYMAPEQIEQPSTVDHGRISSL